VGVAVDQRRGEQAAIEVFAAADAGALRQGIHRSQPGDAAIRDRQCGVFHQSERRLAVQRRQAGMGKQQIPAMGWHGDDSLVRVRSGIIANAVA